MRRMICISMMMLVMTLTAGMASAHQPDRSKQAAVDLSQVDADFALQGEYQGYAKTAAEGRWQRGGIGLQVIARGDGAFDAVMYSGGLPGAGWNRSGTTEFKGERSGELLRMQQGPLQVDVDGQTATISYPGYAANSCIAKIYRVSPTAGKHPPRGAVVLFDGTGVDLFSNGRMSDDGLLMEGADTVDAYEDFTLHLEFRLPYMPYARGQGRANSGVYIQSRYEVQILDSFGLEGAHNECGGLYKQRRPDVNICFPPLRWQTYDIDFRAARFDAAGEKTANARITVRQNGVLIHDDVELTGKTGSGRPEGPGALPTRLQDHGNPVRFRNIWLVEHDGDSPGEKSETLELAAGPYSYGRSSSNGGYYVGGGRQSGSQGYYVGSDRSDVVSGSGILLPRMNRIPPTLPDFPIPPPYPDARPIPNLRYYGHYRMYPRPMQQYWQLEYDWRGGGWAPINYYSPVSPVRRGYWTW